MLETTPWLARRNEGRIMLGDTYKGELAHIPGERIGHRVVSIGVHIAKDGRKSALFQDYCWAI